MKVTGIDAGRIEAMMAQLKAAAQNRPVDAAQDLGSTIRLQPAANLQKTSFADALKSSLNQVNQAQLQAESLGKNFAMGDDRVSLSDVMINMQKANIAFQTTIQVRNKFISAYNDIMNMQI